MNGTKRPKGFPRAMWKSMSEKEKKKASGKRFLDFSTNISTSSYNSGQIGNAQSQAPRARNARNARSYTDGGATGKATSGVVIGNEKRSVTAGGKHARLRFTHKETWGALVSGPTSNGFFVFSYRVQPGLANVFPVASLTAVQWQNYHIKSMKVSFVPDVSQYAVAGSTGRVLIAFNADVADPIPADLQTMQNMEPSVQAMASDNIALMIDQSLFIDDKFVRTGSVPFGNDPKTYDSGVVYISTQGFPASSLLGDIFVEYDIEFIGYRVNTNSLPTVSPTNFWSKLNSALPVTLTTGVPALVQTSGGNTSSAIDNWNQLGLTFASGPPYNWVAVPFGRYLIQGIFQFNNSTSQLTAAYGWVGTSLTVPTVPAAQPPTNAGGNAAPTSGLNDYILAGSNIPASGFASLPMNVMVVNNTSGPMYVTLNASTIFAGGVTQVYFQGFISTW